MKPHASKPLRLQPLIDQVVEQIGDRSVVEGDRRHGTALLDHQHVDQQQRIGGGREPKPADLGVAPIPEIEQLGPSVGTKPQTRSE